MLMTKGGEATAWAAGLHPPRRLRRMENGQSIGRIREEREFKPGREWFWSLTITGPHRAGRPDIRLRRQPRGRQGGLSRSTRRL
jgi:hypothetical protein